MHLHRRLHPGHPARHYDGTPDLTFSVSGGNETDRDTVRNAVQAWGGTGIEFDEVSRGANIAITLQKGGGMIAGSAKRNFDRSGYVKSVTLKISLKAFGNPNDQGTIGEVTRHEMGHALGLGHANFDDLMDPYVGGPNTVSACDVDGVEAAQSWAFDGSGAPH